MAIFEYMVTLAMMGISSVSFIWVIKQIVLLCYWIFKREMERIENNE